MKRHTLLICAIACVLAAGSGCCQLHSALCYPFGSCIAICDPAHSYDACGPACGGACGSGCEPCAEPCGDVGCDAYCGDPCGGCGHPYGPLSWLHWIFSCGYCGSGCGEYYWSDFHSEPPDCCDPCDQFGNWSGGGGAVGCGQCGGWGDGCGASGGGYCRKRPQPTGLLAGRASPKSHRPAPPRTNVGSQGYVISDPSSPYAPRVVSVTERVVSPAAPTKAAPVGQPAARQVMKQRLTTIPR